MPQTIKFHQGAAADLRRAGMLRKCLVMGSAARLRTLHAWLAPVMLAPLLLTALSGMSYRLLRDWAGLSRDQAHWLMVLHEGEWLGRSMEPVVVLLNGLGLLWMLGTGAGLVIERLGRQLRRRREPLRQTTLVSDSE